MPVFRRFFLQNVYCCFHYYVFFSKLSFKKFLRYNNERSTLFVGNFLKFSALHYFFFSLGNICSLLHTYIDSQSFFLILNSLFLRFNSFYELTEKWAKANLLLDSMLSSRLINPDIRFEVWNFILNLCMT